jgi:hypothetical protein
LRDSHPARVDLATSLAISFPRIDFKLSEHLSQILQTDPALEYRPWKRLFLETLQQSGFDSLQKLTLTLPTGAWPRGAIGGIAACAERLIASPDGRSWLSDWVHETNARHKTDPAFLKPVAAPWCLAIFCLNEDSLLDQWISRFTDPDDSSPLDAVHLEFSTHLLARGDSHASLNQTLRIKAPLVRDTMLTTLANHHLDGNHAESAAELLFLLSTESKRASLSLKLADTPGFLLNPNNIHRLLAACGKEAHAIGKLLANAGLEPTLGFADKDQLIAMAAREGARVVAMLAQMTDDESIDLRNQIEKHLVSNKGLGKPPKS